jgi:CubicO group peptidase (beta-lactamase class C family)
VCSLELKAALENACRQSGVPGAAIAVVDAETAEQAASGLASAATRERLDTGHQFPVMSLAKSMTAAVIVDLASAGNLRLCTPVAELLPELAALSWGGEVTIDHLLGCTGGLPAFHFPDLRDGDDAVSRYPNTMRAVTLLHRPGERFSYSNCAYAVAGSIIEAVTGECFDDVLDREIFKPLGLSNTGSWYRRPPERPVDQHWTAPDGSLVGLDWWRVRSAGGAGAGTLYTTAEDLGRYGVAHLSRWPELREQQVPFPGPHAIGWGRGWALYGWNADVFGWDGFAPGAKTFLRVLPAHGVAVALVTNSSMGRNVYRSVFPTLLRERFGVDMAPEEYPPPRTRIPRETADEIIGRYENGGSWCTVSADERDYVLTDSLARAIRVRPVGGGRYVATEFADYPVVDVDGEWLQYFCSLWAREHT